MKILIINFFYPPIISAHAYRWEQIARHWAAQDHEVEIITSRVHGTPTTALENGVHISRVGFIEKQAMATSDVSHQAGGILRRIKTHTVNAFRPLYRKLYWPDGYWHWTLSATWAALKRRRVGYDLIVSYYPCMGAHLAGAALCRWGASKDSRWIADYGDPFSVSATMPPNNFKFYGKLNKFVERNIFKTATAVVFTNSDTAELYETISLEGGNLCVIPHLVDLSKIQEAAARTIHEKPDKKNAEDSINILYIGGFHKGIREPFVLFDLIRNLNLQSKTKFVLNIFGPENGFNLSPEDCPAIIYGGVIEREKAIEMMVAADVLVNVENRNCVMAPSKVVEYIGTGRPIINIEDGGIKISELEAYIASGNALSISKKDICGEPLKAIAKFILNHAGHAEQTAIVKGILADRTLEKIAKQYLIMQRGNSDKSAN